MGLIPEVLAKKLGIASSTTITNRTTNKKSSTCCNAGCGGDNNDTTAASTTSCSTRTESSVSTDDSSSDTPWIVEITSQPQLQKLMQTNPIVILKFTAEWCKPCKTIQPFYEKLAADSTLRRSNSGSQVAALFGMVDVDEADDVASEFKVAMMPTFVAIRDGKVVETMSGANEVKLEGLVQKVLSME